MVNWMGELQYQVDLLNEMNQKLSNDEKMFQMICTTSSSAFLYYSFEDDMVRTLANWQSFLMWKLKVLRISAVCTIVWKSSIEYRYAIFCS